MESEMPIINIGPVAFDLTILIMSALIVVLVFSLVFWASRNMTLKPKGKQNVLEYVYDFVFGVIKGELGEKLGKKFTPFFFVVFTFLLFANNLGLMTKIQTPNGYNWWGSPTSNMAFDFALSILMSLVIQYQAIKIRGVKHYIKGFITPIAMTPMNLLEEVTNIVSLSLRLYGNIFSGEILLSLLLQMANQSIFLAPFAFAMNVVWVGFSAFISCLQAYVFILLTSIYLGKKVNS
ncbi:F0F1 ATP synthase subunit A [Streptococcus pacificus]|nr:F0F1 ATP synthase subunit A [Streptococcus pacificus]